MAINYSTFFNNMGEKTVWDKTNLKLFCDICKHEVLAEHRPLGHQIERHSITLSNPFQSFVYGI
jgi:hypothetical protein